jgi:hypothetical protein
MVSPSRYVKRNHTLRGRDGRRTSLAFVDGLGNTCALGDPTQPGLQVGSPTTQIGGLMVEDFSQSANPNYSFSYLDTAKHIAYGSRVFRPSCFLPRVRSRP